MFYLAAFEILTIPWNNTHPIGIHGHRVNSSNDEIGFHNRAGSSRAARGQGPSGIKDGKLRFDDGAQVGYCLIDIILRMKTLSIPDETHQSLHAHAHTRGGMRLSNGNVDQNRSIQNLFHDLYVFQYFSLGNLDLLKEFSFLKGENMDAGNVFTGFSNACSFAPKFCPMQGLI